MSRLKTVLLLGLLTGLFLWLGGMVGGRAGATIALVLAGIMNIGAWWFSDRVVLAMHRAREVPPGEAPRLHAMVEELAVRAKLPKPRLFLVEDPMPNAFATGRNPSKGVVAVTTGLLSILDEDELRGVIAHELSHIANRDTLISTVAATIAGAIAWMAQMLFFFAGPARDDDDGVGIGGIGLLLVSPLLAAILQMAISRTREFRADDLGAELTGTGAPLARALLKLDRSVKRVHSTTAQPTFAPLYIVHPFTGGGLGRLFSTHPSTDDRVKRLMQRSPEIAAFWQPREV